MARRARGTRLRRGGRLPEPDRRRAVRYRRRWRRSKSARADVPQGEGHSARRRVWRCCRTTNPHVKADLAKIADGKKLSPILLVRGDFRRRGAAADRRRLPPRVRQLSDRREHADTVPPGVVAVLTTDMSGFGFDTLALLVVVGMAGPLLAAVPGLRDSGRSSANSSPECRSANRFRHRRHTDPTFTLLANIGFALVMFVVGTHVPVRDTIAALGASQGGAARRARRRRRRGARAWRWPRAFGTGHAALYAVLMASSSAASALPVIDSLEARRAAGALGHRADRDRRRRVDRVAAVGDRPEPRAAGGTRRTGHRGMRGGAVLGAAALRATRGTAQAAARVLGSDRVGARAARQPASCCSRCRALAISTHVSIMLAGFALGLVVAAIGEPRRLARQLFGVTEGFFAPLFFVWLGASLQVRELADHPRVHRARRRAGGRVRSLAHCAAGYSVSRWRWRCLRPPSSAYRSRRRLWAPSRTCSARGSRRR